MGRNEWDTKFADETAHLYAIRPIVKWAGNNGDAVRVSRFGAKNPDSGSTVWFHLPKPPKEGVTIKVTDKDGKLVCEAMGKSDVKKEERDEDDDGPIKREYKLKDGLNRFVWDMTYDGAEMIPGAKVDSGFPGMTIPATPGEYTVELLVGKQSFKQKAIVRPDPRVRPLPAPDAKVTKSNENDPLKISFTRDAADEKKESEQLAMALKVRDDITKLSQTVLRLRAILKQINLRKELLKGQDNAKELVKQSTEYAKKLNELEEKLHNPKAKVVYDVFGPRGGAMLYSQLTWLLGNLIDGDGPPTKAQREFTVEVEKRLTGHVEEFDKLTGDELKKLNEEAKKLGVPELYVPPVKKPGEKKEEKKVD